MNRPKHLALTAKDQQFLDDIVPNVIPGVGSSTEWKLYRLVRKLEAAYEEIENRATQRELEVQRLRQIIERSRMYLPVIEGNQLAYVDFDLIPHVIAVADEFEVLRNQVEAFKNAEKHTLA